MMTSTATPIDAISDSFLSLDVFACDALWKIYVTTRSTPRHRVERYCPAHAPISYFRVSSASQTRRIAGHFDHEHERQKRFVDLTRARHLHATEQ